MDEATTTAATGASLGSIIPGVGTAVGAIGGALVGGLIGRSGANKANFDSQMFAVNQAKYQQYLADTAHQREVKDLLKAGLNPLLSANKGATVPGTVSANFANPNEAMAKGIGKVNPLDPTILLGVEQLRANIAKTRAEEALIDAQTRNVEDQNAGIAANNIVRGTAAIKAQQDRDLIDSWFGRNIVAPIRVIFGDTGTSVGTPANYMPKTHVNR